MTATTRAPVVVFGKLSGLGLLLVGFAALIAAVTYFLRVANAQGQAPASAPVAEEIKRDFQLVQLGEFRRDQFLIDRSSGRVWQSVCSGEVSGPDCKGMLIWDEMYVDGVTPGDSAAAMVYRQQIMGRK